MHGAFSPRVEDCRSGQVIYGLRLAKPLRPPRKIVDASGVELTCQFLGPRREMFMQVADQMNSPVLLHTWLSKQRGGPSFDLGEATVRSTPLEGDTAWLISVAFEI